MIRLAASFFLLLFTACATMPHDERLDVDAALIVDSEEVQVYRVVLTNSSERALTIENVEVMPIGGSHVTRAYSSAGEVISPGQFEVFTVSTETDARQRGRKTEEIGGPFPVASNRGRIVKPTARVYVTFFDGSERTTASYKVDV